MGFSSVFLNVQRQEHNLPLAEITMNPQTLIFVVCSSGSYYGFWFVLGHEIANEMLKIGGFFFQ